MDYHQVEVDAIVDRHLINPMREVIKSLAEIVEEWISAGTIPEVEWIRMRSLDFQEVLRARNELARQLDKYTCTLCGDFEHHVSFSRFLS
jgi:antiviral helicase SKI2